MFERFTERASRVVVLAQDEARALDHDYIGTEHLLLGLFGVQEGVAAKVLDSLDVTAEEVRAQVVRVVGRGNQPPQGEIPFTRHAKKALELALRESLSLGNNYIGAEHILLGLVRERNGVAARILLDFDVDSETVRSEVVRMLSSARPAAGAGEPSKPRRAPSARSPTATARSQVTSFPLAVGWALFAVAFGIGLLAGWLIWA